MRLPDYLKLGAAGIKAHKRGTLLVVVIAGVLYSVIIATTLLLQGLDNAIMHQMLAPTGGKILVVSSVNQKFCGEDCKFSTEAEHIRANVAKYGGEAMEVTLRHNADGNFYQLPQGSGLFADAQPETKLASNVIPVMAPFSTVMALGNYQGNTQGLDAERSLNLIREVNAEFLHKTVTSPSGQKYYIAGILPDAVFAQDLSLANLGLEQKNNPLNVLLDGFRLGTSQSFSFGWNQEGNVTQGPSDALSTGNVQPEPDKVSTQPDGTSNQSDGTPNQPDEVSSQADETSGQIDEDTSRSGGLSSQTNQAILAIFDNIDAAYKYYKDKANYCSASDQHMQQCHQEYKYQTATAVAEPPENYEKLQNIWMIYRMIVIILLIVAMSVLVTTYIRLIAKDSQNITLYKIMGARKGQITIVYAIYLLLISILVMVFALGAGFGLAALLNLAVAPSFAQVLSLASGQIVADVWLLGWNNLLWPTLLSIGVATLLTLAIEYGQFSRRAALE